MSIKVGDTIKIKYNGAIMELKLREEVCSGGVTVGSPVGRALLNHGDGERFTVDTPDGMAEVEILGG